MREIEIVIVRGRERKERERETSSVTQTGTPQNGKRPEDIRRSMKDTETHKRIEVKRFNFLPAIVERVLDAFVGDVALAKSGNKMPFCISSSR